jgi:hypothetical protein
MSNAEHSSQPEERFTEPVADRPPTPDEEAAAERAAEQVDIDRVAEHAEQAARTGAGVQGEGEIEPTRPD